MNITGAIQNKSDLKYCRDGNVYYIKTIDNQFSGLTNSIQIYYEGNPQKANTLLGMGVSWSSEKNKNNFIALFF